MATTILVQQAGRFLQAGRLVAARATIAALRRGPADGTTIDEIEARLCMAEGNLPGALALLDGAIVRLPASAGLHLLRAEARAQSDDHLGAVADAAEAVLLAPDNARAKAMLGLTLIELDRPEDAIACLRDAVRAAPGLAAAWQGLAEALGRAGDEDASQAVHDAAILNVAQHAGLRVAAMMQAMRRGDFARVVGLAVAARQAGLADACIFGLHGHALSKLDRHAEAAGIYQDALRLAPEDPYVRHLVQAAGLLPQDDRAPPDYLAAVFDGYAGRFEQHLIGLGYRGPLVIRDALVAQLEEAGGSLGEVLDLGCGTGLVGVLISDLPMAGIMGVDISEKMIAQARDKRIYEELIVADIPAYLAGTQRQWDSVIAGDVFCYFGALGETFAAVSRKMRAGGVFVLTLEQDEGAGGRGWRLGSQGRYVHDPAYVMGCLEAAGFTVAVRRDETLRLEAGAAVRGMVIVARKAVLHG